MNIYAELVASWAAFDVVLVAVWHTAHVIARAQHNRPTQTQPTPARSHTVTVSQPPANLTLAQAS